MEQEILSLYPLKLTQTPFKKNSKKALCRWYGFLIAYYLFFILYSTSGFLFLLFLTF